MSSWDDRNDLGLGRCVAQNQQNLAREFEKFVGVAERSCDSEIEKMLMVALLLRQCLELAEFDEGATHFTESGVLAGGGLRLERQYTVAPPRMNGPLDLKQFAGTPDDNSGRSDFIFPQYCVGQYRADFLIFRTIGRRISPVVIVECDGHDYHERTKEQAARDKERDRWFQTEGYCVLRFTGSEIWADPDACAQQVYEFLERRTTFDGKPDPF